MDSKDVGKYIKAIREEKKISQRKLAEMIGRGESTIGNYETGATDIPCSALLDIAQQQRRLPLRFTLICQRLDDLRISGQCERIKESISAPG